MLLAFLALPEVPVEDAARQALDPPQRGRQTLEAVRHLLLRESQCQPLLLIVEDLHWIDSETQAVLDRLVDSLPTDAGASGAMVEQQPNRQRLNAGIGAAAAAAS
jgi:predicted ATPase